MKKFLCLLAALLIAAGCDDGEMDIQSFDFGDANVQRCGDNTFYKVNGTELLILTISPSLLQNVESGPVQYVLSGANSITYRNYSGTGGQNTLCSDIPSSSPSVVEEWSGEGTISIETVAVNGAESGLLTGYVHKIVLVDISFNNDGEEIRIVNNEFGSVQTNLGFDFDFEFTDENLQQPDVCDDNNIVYKIRSDETLVFVFDDGTFPNTVGNTVIELDNTTDGNSLLYNIYTGSAGQSNVCDNYTLSPQLKQKWNATDGTIVITTTYDDTANLYDHDIYFKDVEFTNAANGNETFLISDIATYDETTGFYYGRINTD